MPIWSRASRRGGTDKFSGLRTRPSTVGSPALDGVPVRLDCTTWNRYDGGDHVIIIGEVRAIAAAAHPRP